MDRLRMDGEQLARLLEPGEEPLELTMAGYMGGQETELGRPRQPVAFDPILGFDFPALNALAERAIAGQNLIWYPGSAAKELAVAFGSASDLAVTSRRLLAVGGLNASRAEPAIVFARALAQVARIERAQRLGQRGRIRVVFTDGSMAALMLGTLTAGKAKSVVTAWQRASGATLSP